MPRLSMAKTLFLSMKRFGSNIPILVDQLLGTKTVPPNGTTLISMKERMASILWHNSMAAMPPMGYGLSQGHTTHALTYRDFTKTLDQIDSLTPSRCYASLAMSRSATGKPCTEALPTPRQTLGSPSTLASTGDPLFSVLRATVSIVLKQFTMSKESISDQSLSAMPSVHVQSVFPKKRLTITSTSQSILALE